MGQNRLETLGNRFIFIFLKKLDLRGNSLSEVKNFFLPSLEELHLENNKMSGENNSALYLPNLKTVFLQNNRLNGFSAVWEFLRYSRGLENIVYEGNSIIDDLRQKVKEVYEHILYKNMSKLKKINYHDYDLGIKKYYEGAYDNYLSGRSIFLPQSRLLAHMGKKVNFTIRQSKFISELEDSKCKFSESEIFIRFKSVMKVNDLVQIVEFLESEKKSSLNIFNVSNSIFHEHDLFEFQMRNKLHKIRGMLIGRMYRMAKRKQYFK